MPTNLKTRSGFAPMRSCAAITVALAVVFTDVTVVRLMRAPLPAGMTASPASFEFVPLPLGAEGTWN